MHYYQEAIKLNPDFSRAYINMGTITIIDGETEKGLEYLLKAMEFPIEDEFILSVLYEDLIKVYTKLENLKEAAYFKLKLANLESVAEENDENFNEEEK